MSKLHDWITSAFASDDSQSKWRGFLGLAVVLGLLAALVPLNPLSLSQASEWSAIVILAGAALFVGVLTGFLFGIPKTSRRKTEAPNSPGLSLGDYEPNTNLEDISDWLTKMLIGVGLIELRSVPEILDSIATYWQGSFSHPNARAFVSGLIIYFAIIGFLAGYLWTRLALIGDFITSHPARKIEELLQGVGAATESDPNITERTPQRQVVTSAQAKAAQAVQAVAKRSHVSLEQLRQQVRELADFYESIRATMPSGPARTRQMEIVAGKMRAFSLAAFPLLGELSHSSSPGERLAAITFLQTRPHRDYYGWLAERLAVEKPFVGYHAAVALLNAARNASADDAPLLDQSIESVLQATSTLLGSDRRAVLEAAREALATSGQAE